MAETLSLPIEDDNGLEAASAVLHDAVFQKEGIHYDSGLKRFTLHLWREVLESKRQRSVCLVFRVTEHLRAACTLTLFNVESANVRVRDKCKYYSVFRLNYDRDNRTLRFETEGTIDITLQLDKLAGILVDTGETTWEQFGYCTISLFPWTK